MHIVHDGKPSRWVEYRGLTDLSVLYQTAICLTPETASARGQEIYEPWSFSVELSGLGVFQACSTPPERYGSTRVSVKHPHRWTS